MTTDQTIAFAVLGAALLLFVWGRWRYDLVALAALLAVTVAGLVPASDAFLGFAHPAVITVAAVLVISRALRNAGIIDLAVRLLEPLRGNATGQLAAQSTLVGLLSSFMNNVGAMALMLPVALRTAYRDGHAPAMVLMPLAFASLLGGLITMIGTPPNIIIATFRAQQTGEPFAMFDFAPVGLAVALVGILFTTLIGWRLLPRERRGQPEAEALFKIEDYIAEARVTETSESIDRSISELEAMTDHGASIVGLIRNEHRHLIPSGYERVRAGDVLILEGDPSVFETLVDLADLEFIGSETPPVEDLRSDQVGIVEAVVNHGASIVGRSPRALRLRTIHRVNLLALARHGKPERKRLSDIRFQVGDVVLLQGISDDLPDVLQSLGCLPLAERKLRLGHPRRLILAAAIFGMAIAAALFGLLPIHIAFVAAVVALIVGDVVSLADSYDAIDWPVIVLLGAMIPVGGALEVTGGAALVANTIVGMSAGLDPAWVLLILFIGTMFVSDLINNNATAVLMAPIAFNTAEQLGVRADPFLMAIALAASCAFLTPIGHQSNTLVMAPGGYRFSDYWRMGLPLEILIVMVGVPMILWVWPL
ncbi:MAG: SLC13 family permease [Proteobacteria bacterium]|nr:SLC13 family permease [Pseudomonadota bacterium]